MEKVSQSYVAFLRTVLDMLSPGVKIICNGDHEYGFQ